ncbi:unnamed protein product [Citrullus colocynthis]|uniref:Uncharacterized protein n=1 Tax=Citrullus colocynthis TaxID=252529 RepID=A0ABP0YB08_9ROSI
MNVPPLQLNRLAAIKKPKLWHEWLDDDRRWRASAVGGSARERKNEEDDDERKRDDRDSEGGKSCAAELLKNLSRSKAPRDIKSSVLDRMNDGVPINESQEYDISILSISSSRVGISHDEIHGTPTSQNTQERDAMPKQKRATKVELRAEVVSQLQDSPELYNQQSVKLMNIVFHSVQDTKSFLSIPTPLKLEYCRSSFKRCMINLFLKLLSDSGP